MQLMHIINGHILIWLKIASKKKNVEQKIVTCIIAPINLD